MPANLYRLTLHQTFPTLVHPADDASPRGKFYSGAVIGWAGPNHTGGFVAATNWGPGQFGGDFFSGQIGTSFHDYAYDAANAVLRKLRSKHGGGYEDTTVRVSDMPLRLEQLILAKLGGVANANAGHVTEEDRKAKFYSGANFEANALTILGTSTPAGIDLLVNMRADMQAWRADLDRADAALSLAQDAIRDRLIKGDEA